MVTLIKLKRNKLARMNTMQAQVEEIYFMFYREYMNAALSREITWIANKASMLI
jgi:hypothetical protein